MNNAKPIPAADDFHLTAGDNLPAFELEPSPAPNTATAPEQAELYFPDSQAEVPEASPQIGLAGMEAPRYEVRLTDGRHAHFQHAHNLLESLEAQGVDMHYQCREGYCGSCRVKLLQGAVHYTLEPMAWLNDGEILTCCSVPKTDLKIQLPN